MLDRSHRSLTFCGYPISGTLESISGYLLSTNQIPDINECKDGNGGCHQYATCDNEEGSFECTCNTGYTGDGTSCVGEECRHSATIMACGIS